MELLWTTINDNEISVSLKLRNVICGPHDRQYLIFTPLTPNDHYSGRTAPLTSKLCILYNYSTNTGTEYFKHCI